MNELFHSKKCPYCKKMFVVTCYPDEWGYAYGDRLVCSYSCMRAMERADKERVRAKNRPIPAGEMFYKQRCQGKSYEEMTKSGTASSYNLDTPEKMQGFVYHWVARNQDKAEEIRKTVDAAMDRVSRKEIAVELGIKSETVGKYARRIGISGITIGQNIMYTKDEAAIIKDEIGRASA